MPSNYLKIARPDHWFKNIFMLPGLALAHVTGAQLTLANLWQIPAGIAAVCMIVSANYTINEWLDREFDKFHPTKKYRPSVVSALDGRLVYAQWTVLAVLGLLLSYAIRIEFAAVNLTLLVMGVLYNVKPFRTKDRVYVDVLTESINNPLRFLLGWYLLETIILPPSSILLAYWMGGAFLMAIKRYSEYRYIGNASQAGQYRQSFRFYTEESLLLSAFLYAVVSSTFLGVFLVKYRVEFLLFLPFVAVLFAWYLHIGMKTNSVSQTPEKLYREPYLGAYVALSGLVFVSLLYVKIPQLEFLLDMPSRMGV